MRRGFQDLEAGSSDPSLDIREVLRRVARRKWLVLAIVILVGALAAFYSYTRPPVYSASARVLVDPDFFTGQDDTDPSDNVFMQDEVELARSGQVAKLVREEGTLDASVDELLDHVSVSSPENTHILLVSFTDRDPVVAQRAAQGFAEAYLEYRATLAVNEAQAAQAQIEERLTGDPADPDDGIEGEIDNLQAQLDAVTDPATEATLNDDLSFLESQRDALVIQLANLDDATTTDPGQVIQNARRPTTPISPRHEVDLALGILLGLGLGVVLASIQEQLRDRLQEPAALEEQLGAPTLGMIPASAALRGDIARLVTIDEPRGAAAEAYRTLRTNLLAATRASKIRTILVTSAGPGEGKTTTAVNLAVALAQVDRSVVLISADLRHPRLHPYFGVGNEWGLGQVLTGEVQLTDALVDTTIPRLQVLPSGPVSTLKEPVELLQSGRMAEVIRRCRQADFVILDSPPIEPVADALVLAGVVEGVLFVADARLGTRAAVAGARHQLEQVGGTILGGVLNGTDGSLGRESYEPPPSRRRPFDAASGAGGGNGASSRRPESTRRV
jgi:succinoglycan biosynthesis transport protein ExoP